MKFEIQCSSCNGSYVIDEEALGGDLVCPNCSVTTATSESAGPGISAPADQIVCPRCSLHFSPHSASDNTVADDRPTVLIVEDMLYFREVASDALVEDYNVRTAETRQQALDILRGGDIDVMVLDLTLDGGEHGLDLLRSLPNKPCHILIYTAADETEMYGGSWEELQRLGADDIVIKGMNVGESLARKVDSLLGRNLEGEG